MKSKLIIIEMDVICRRYNMRVPMCSLQTSHLCAALHIADLLNFPTTHVTWEDRKPPAKSLRVQHELQQFSSSRTLVCRRPLLEDWDYCMHSGNPCWRKEVRVDYISGNPLLQDTGDSGLDILEPCYRKEVVVWPDIWEPLLENRGQPGYV